MAVLTSTGITFSDSTVLNSKYGIVPQFSVTLFFLASAPTGWTQVTAHNDKTLRIVSTSGGGSGGSISYTASASVPFSVSVPVTITGTVNDTTLSTPQIPSHSHPTTLGASLGRQVTGTPQPNRLPPSPGSTGDAGGGLAHNHPFSATSASGPFSGNINVSVQYVDVIVCSFL